mmetsp:Transcript_594/g.1664  ORF Transcript_594/g.1664 Transcript_594/m.1664 type:complete len:332 (+) Transcript_594:107-1102(+)
MCSHSWVRIPLLALFFLFFPSHLPRQHGIQVGHRVRSHCPCGSAQVHRVRVQNSHGVRVGVVVEEVVLVHVVQRGTWHTNLHPGRDVRPLAVGEHVRGVDRLQKIHDLLHYLGGSLRPGELDAKRLEHAQIRLHHQVVVRRVGLVRVKVLLRADSAELFARPHDQSHGTLRAQSQGVQRGQHLPRDERASAIVHRALADVPAVEVSAHEHHLVRHLRPDDLGHRVSGRRVRQGGRAHEQVQHGDRAAILHALQHFGVFDRDARSRDLLHVARVVLHARVWCVERERSHASDQTRHGAHPRRRTGALRAVCHSGAVVHPLLVEHHDPSLGFG